MERALSSGPDASPTRTGEGTERGRAALSVRPARARLSCVELTTKCDLDAI